MHLSCECATNGTVAKDADMRPLTSGRRRPRRARLVTTNFKSSEEEAPVVKPKQIRHPLTVSCLLGAKRGCKGASRNPSPSPGRRAGLTYDGYWFTQEDAFAGASPAETATQEVLFSTPAGGAASAAAAPPPPPPQVTGGKVRVTHQAGLLTH